MAQPYEPYLPPERTAGEPARGRRRASRYLRRLRLRLLLLACGVVVAVVRCGGDDDPAERERAPVVTEQERWEACVRAGLPPDERTYTIEYVCSVQVPGYHGPGSVDLFQSEGEPPPDPADRYQDPGAAP